MERVKKIPYIEFIPVILIAILFYKLMDNLAVFGSAINYFFNILTPFIWAVLIAFIANPILKRIEKKFKLNRAFSILITYTLIIGSFTLIMMLLIPIIALNINDLVVSTPDYLKKVETLITTNAAKYEAFTKINYLTLLSPENIQKLTSNLSNYFGIFTSLVSGLLGFTSGVIKMLLGMIISIYILIDKEKFKKDTINLINKLFVKEKAKKIIDLIKEANDIFSRYLIGQATDSIVVACISFVGFLIIGVPYAVLLAIIAGITNMIPYFGPIIGMVPIVGLTLLNNPQDALIVLIFMIVLQQIDGNIIAPRIVGGSVGVSPFWSILAIVVGGSLFGIAGMILCVPTFALLRNQVVRALDLN